MALQPQGLWIGAIEMAAHLQGCGLSRKRMLALPGILDRVQDSLDDSAQPWSIQRAQGI